MARSPRGSRWGLSKAPRLLGLSWKPLLSLLFVVLLVGGPAYALTPGSLAPPGGSASQGAGAHPASLRPPPVYRPFGTTTVNGTFWENTSVAGNQVGNASSLYCDQYYPGYFCFPQAAYPNVLPMPDGRIGYAYENLTNQTTNQCPLALNNSTEVRVEFTLSKDGGQTFTTPIDLGNTTCPYFQALEPSFAVSSNGAIDGAFVEANATPNSMNCPSGCGPFWAQTLWYAPRYDDALGFVSSTNSGNSFHAVQTIGLAGVGNIAGPSVATFGDTVYIAYMDLNNTTTSATLGNSTAAPISVELVYSSDGGGTWHGPYGLPGFNASEYYNAMNPQVAVAPDGTVYVAYSSDRHCIAYCAYSTNIFGDDIYLASSTTNGTSWSAHLVAKDTGDAEDLSQTPLGVSFGNGPVSGPYIFEEGPAISVAVSPTTSDVFVAWTGSINESDHYYCGPPTWPFNIYCVFDSYAQTVMYVARSANAGASWTNESVGPYHDYYSQTQPNGEYMPGLGVSPLGTVYLTYSYYNGSNTANGCDQEGAYGGGPGFQGQYVTSSLDGINWSGPDLLAWDVNGQGGWWLTGWTSSVAFNVTTGAPLLGYALTEATNNQPVGNTGLYTFPGVVQLAQPFHGTTTSLTIQSTGLPSGTEWKAWVMGETFTSTASNLTVANAPTGRQIWVKTGLPPVYAGYGAAYLANLTLPVSDNGFNYIGNQPFLNLSGPGLFYLNYSLYYDLNFSMQPGSLINSDLSFDLYDPGYNFADWLFFANGAYGGGCAFPWLVPSGWHVHLTGYRGTGYLPSHTIYVNDNNQGAIGYYNGSGIGSYTGVGPNGSITMSGPINETGWITSYGVYNISVGAPELAAGTAVHFTWGGTPYSFVAPGPFLVRNVSTGTYAVSNIWASASAPGYEYFGTTDTPNPVEVPNDPVVNFTFSYIDLGSAIGTVAFRANGTTPGTPWQFSANGTTYSSTNPWINVSTRSGTIAVSGYPIVAQNGSAGYVPVGIPPTLSVSTGSTYLVNFTPAFRVVVAPSVGGTISPAGASTWVAVGTELNFTEHPDAGYTFGGWTGKGAGSYTGLDPTASVTVRGPITETPSFVPMPVNHYSLTFQEGSLPAGTSWTVYVDGTGYTTNSTLIVVPNLYDCAAGAAGTYQIQIPYVYVNGTVPLRYAPTGYPASACGGSAIIEPNFLAQYYLTVLATAGGSVTATSYATGAALPAGAWVTTGDTVALVATPSAQYRFVGWQGTGAGSYSGPANPEDLVISGPASEVAEFVPAQAPPAPSYTVDFQASAGRPAGLSWSLTLGGTTYTSTQAQILVTGLLAGTYPLQVPVAVSADEQTEAVPSNAPNSVHVGPNATVTLDFQTEYWLSVRVVGPGTVSPGSEWVATGTTVDLTPTASPGDSFSGWTGSGAGAYTGPGPQATVTVTAPSSEVATFLPATPTASGAGSALSPSAPLLIGAAVVALVAGVAAGVFFGRRRTGERRDPTGDSGPTTGGPP